MDLMPEVKLVGMQMRELMPTTVKELGNAHVWGR